MNESAWKLAAIVFCTVFGGFVGGMVAGFTGAAAGALVGGLVAQVYPGELTVPRWVVRAVERRDRLTAARLEAEHRELAEQDRRESIESAEFVLRVARWEHERRPTPLTQAALDEAERTLRERRNRS